MFILKIIRTFKKPTQVYTDITHKVDEEKRFINLSSQPVIQTLVPNDNDDTIYAVVDNMDTYFIHRDEHAYLLNKDGKTLEIIHRP